ncbi:MAG: hypothetical protein IJT07_03175 [Oscillospiraceae bacterium]|nr:hypothetical protein [Oscillospiraceae bacterium]
MRKLIGMLLIVLGGAYGAKVGCDAIRAQSASCCELAQALRRLKSEITLHRKLPDALFAAAKDDSALGDVIRTVASQIRAAPERVPTLSFAALPVQVGEILSKLLELLGGAEEDCLDAIDAALAQADDLATKLAQQERDKLRVCRTMWLSGAAVVAILLG